MKVDRLVEASYPSNIPGVLGDLTLLVVTGELHKRLRGTLLNLLAGVKVQNSSFLAHIEENAVQVMLSWATKKTVYKGGFQGLGGVGKMKDKGRRGMETLIAFLQQHSSILAILFVFSYPVVALLLHHRKPSKLPPRTLAWFPHLRPLEF